MLDAIARVTAGFAQRRDGDHQLSGGDAVDGDRVVVAMPIGDPAGQLLEVQIVVVQDALARGQAVHVLAQFAVPVQLRQADDVGDTRDPVWRR